MDQAKQMETVIRIPKLEIYDMLSVEINEDTPSEANAPNYYEQNNYTAPNEQMMIDQLNATDPNATDTEFNRCDNRILFENYFSITSRERNAVTAACNFCKESKAFRGCLNNTIRFVKHLEVSVFGMKFRYLKRKRATKEFGDILCLWVFGQF